MKTIRFDLVAHRVLFKYKCAGCSDSSWMIAARTGPATCMFMSIDGTNRFANTQFCLFASGSWVFERHEIERVAGGGRIQGIYLFETELEFMECRVEIQRMNWDDWGHYIPEDHYKVITGMGIGYIEYTNDNDHVYALALTMPGEEETKQIGE